MPQAINLVVKNAANVDKTFALLAPAAGNGGIAEWALKECLISGAFPRVTVSAGPTRNGSRNAKIKLVVPNAVTDTGGNTVIQSKWEANVSVSVPNTFPEAKKDDPVAFLQNIMANAMVKEVVRDAFAAT